MPAMGASCGKFLIVDDHLDNRYLLTKTLSRKYPLAEIRECDQIGAAIAIAGGGDLTAVICHRADLTDGIELIRQIRRVNSAVPIIMVSGFDRTREALAAGASRFLPYDEWLRIGAVTADVLALGRHAATVSILTFAIERRFIVTFAYSDPARSCQLEPHLVGESAGRLVVRGFILTPGSRHPLRTAGWATYLIDGIKELGVTQRLFAPHPNDAECDPSITRVICKIEGTASGFIPRPALR